MKSSMISNCIATPVMGITCEDVHDDALELNKKIMPTFMWWIDEPSVKGSRNPSDEDLANFVLRVLTWHCRCWWRVNSHRHITRNRPKTTAGLFTPFLLRKIMLPRSNRFTIS